mgnify:CR=1 FL=1
MQQINILRLLDEVKELLGAKPDYHTPKRKFTFLEFLERDDYDKQDDFLTYNSYADEALLSHPDAILHGHTSKEVCSAPHFCHRRGYLPSAADHPIFVKNFYMKWANLYAPKNIMYAPNQDRKEQ